MSFSNPQLLWGALLVPLVFWLSLRLARRTIDRHSLWVRRSLWRRIGFTPRARSSHSLLLAAALLLAFVAMARPRWGETAHRVEQRGVDIVFVLDSSLSMAAEDLAPNRLEVGKSAIRRLAQAAPGNRVALVQAEGEGFVLAPLTFDSAIIDLLLDTIEVASLPQPGTDLAKAISVALELFDDETAGSQVLFLVSDGENHGHDLERAAAAARARGIVVLTGGVGSTRGVPLPLPGGRGREFKRDAAGEVVVSQLLEPGLEQLARSTGGIYRRIDDAAADLAAFEEAIASQEQQRRERVIDSSREERFQWPLGLAAVCLLGSLLVEPIGRGKP